MEINAPEAAEIEKHRCEVRQLIKDRTANGKIWLLGMLAQIERARGHEYTEKLKADIQYQWDKGHRGDWGLWF